MERNEISSYTIRKGDSLAEVAVKNWDTLVSLRIIPESTQKTPEGIKAAAYELARINGIERPEYVKPGQVVKFNNGRASREVEPVLSVPKPTVQSRDDKGASVESLPRPTSQQQPARAQENGSYKIESGGTLTGAARANWERMQNLGTIPKDWAASDAKQLHMAALRLAQINGIQRPNSVKPGMIKLGEGHAPDDSSPGARAVGQDTIKDKATVRTIDEQKRPPQAGSPPARETHPTVSPDPASVGTQAETRPPETEATPKTTPEVHTGQSKEGSSQGDVTAQLGGDGSKQPQIIYTDQKPDPALVAKAKEESFFSGLTSSSLKRNENGFISFLLTGKDFDGRPDIIKQVLIDPATMKTAIINIPRDLRVQAEGHSKLNAVGRRDADKLADAVKEITGQSSTYRATVSLNDLQSLKPLFSSMFPDGVTLPTSQRYYHAMSGQIYEPHEKITDLSRLEDYLRMRHAYIVSPEWKVGDPLDGQKKLSSSDTDRQKRQSEVMAAMRGQLGGSGSLALGFLDAPLEAIFRPEENRDTVSKVQLAWLAGQLKSSGQDIGRFQPALAAQYLRDGTESQKATKGNPFSSIGIDINGLRSQVRQYFDSQPAFL